MLSLPPLAEIAGAHAARHTPRSTRCFNSLTGEKHGKFGTAGRLGPPGHKVRTQHLSTARPLAPALQAQQLKSEAEIFNEGLSLEEGTAGLHFEDRLQTLKEQVRMEHRSGLSVRCSSPCRLCW